MILWIKSEETHTSQ